MSSRNFRVLIYEPNCKVWTSRLSCAEAMIVAGVHSRCGLVASPVVMRRRLEAEVETLFATAGPADRGTMTTRGIECRYVRAHFALKHSVQLDPLERPNGEDDWDPDDDLMIPAPPEKVTSAEQLAAALGIPPESVIENPPPVAVKLAKAIAELARRMGLFPRGKEGT